MKLLIGLETFGAAVLFLTTAVQGQEAAMVAMTLRGVAGDRVLLGTAIMASHLDEKRHADLIAGQFNAITPGNEMKPDALQRSPGQFTFERGDKIVDFARAQGMQVIGHTLLWHEQSPPWLFKDGNGQPLPRKEALANLRDHMRGVLGHFKGKIKGWDVVNEAVPDGPGDLRETPALRAIGDDYVLKAFEFAAEADPNVELYYNDYNIDMDYKREKGLRLARRIRDAGLRLDAVGIQGHWGLENPSLEEIEKGIRAYADEGFKVMITEMDIDPLPRKGSGGADLSASEREGLDPYKESFPPEMQRKLAERYRRIFELLLRFPQVTRITFWGTTDGNSWLNDFPVRGRTNHPMLWDREYRPKPAFDAVLEALAAARPK